MPCRIIRPISEPALDQLTKARAAFTAAAQPFDRPKAEAALTNLRTAVDALMTTSEPILLDSLTKP